MATRRYQRFVVEKVGIYTKTLHATEVELLNISMTGACVRVRESLKVSEKHLLKLHSKGMSFTLQCHVVWESADREGKLSGKAALPAHKAGIAFDGTASDKMIILKDFIRVSGTANGQRLSDEYGPSALRFQVYSNEKALLYSARTSYAKKISLGGMLVELDDAIQLERRFPLALFLPRQDISIKVQGRVASCIEMPGKRGKRFDVGIEFLEMADKDKARLSRFLLALRAAPLHKKLWRLFKKAR